MTYIARTRYMSGTIRYHPISGGDSFYEVTKWCREKALEKGTVEVTVFSCEELITFRNGDTNAAN